MLSYMAEAEPAKSGLIQSLGIDWRLLVIQTIAFLILLWVLAKYVYPVLSNMLEKREATIKEGIDAAQAAEKKADKANAEIEKLLDEARKQAGDVVTTAKNEATSIVETATTSAHERTERMIKEAQAEIENEVASARQALRDETISLVALATEKVVGKAMTEPVDKKVIASALKDNS